MITQMCSTKTAFLSNEKTKLTTKYICQRTSRLMMILLIAAVMLFLGAFPAFAATGEDVINTAEEYLGYPYAYQASGPNAFDCGGFVWYVFNQAGVDFELRINSTDLAAENLAIYDAADLEIGDIIFFGSTPQTIYHWGIYAGGGQVIHSYNEGTGVTYTPLERVIPSFCYAARLTSLLGCNVDYPAELVESANIPEILLPAVEQQLVPKAYQYDYDKNIKTKEMASLINNLCEVTAGVNTKDLLKLAQLQTDDMVDLWQDPLLLASRALAIVENLPKDINREAAVVHFFYALFEQSSEISIVPELAMTNPYTHIPAGAFKIYSESEGAFNNISSNPSYNPKDLGASVIAHSEKPVYTRAQAFLTIERIHNIFLQLPEE